MPIMTITTLSGKKAEDKEKLAKELTEEIHALMNLPKEVIRVIFQEIPAGSYAVGGEMLSPNAKEPAERDDTILQIRFLFGHSKSEKKEIINHLADVLKKNPPFSSASIRVIIEIGRAHV